MSDELNATLDARRALYGDFSGHAAISQSLKRIIKESPAAKNFLLSDIAQESLEMIVHKIARLLNGDPNYKDTWHDIAGYAKLVEERLK